MKQLTYIKHLIECDCILPQFSSLKEKIWHKFPVFSIIKSDGTLQASYAACNNCGAIHKVVEVGLSKRLAKEETTAIPTIKELKLSIPEDLRGILESYKIDLPTWQEIAFIFENSLWGKVVVLTREESDNGLAGKALSIIGKSLYKIYTYNTSEEDDDDE